MTTIDLTTWRSTPTRQVFFLGVPAEDHEVRRAGPAGERFRIIRWLADADDSNGRRHAGDVTISHLRGDGTKGTLVVYRKAILPTPSDEDVTTWMADSEAGL